ncbi:hypothetical protein ACQR3P_01670 [Rhodococcus sp. IEGM1300]
MTDKTELKQRAEELIELERVSPCGSKRVMLIDPETVAALIAENEVLSGLLKCFVDGEHDQNENQAERHMYFTEAQSLLALVSGELEAHTIVPDSAIRAIHTERDQLKAENEALRNDAERYRYLRDCCGLVEYKRIAGSIGPGMLPSGERLDITVDAVMGRRAPHG